MIGRKPKRSGKSRFRPAMPKARNASAIKPSKERTTENAANFIALQVRKAGRKHFKIENRELEQARSLIQKLEKLMDGLEETELRVRENYYLHPQKIDYARFRKQKVNIELNREYAGTLIGILRSFLITGEEMAKTGNAQVDHARIFAHVASLGIEHFTKYFDKLKATGGN